jgi:transposase
VKSIKEEKMAKLTLETLEEGLKERKKKTKYEAFLEENREVLIGMLNKGYSPQDIAKAINVHLAKINKSRKQYKAEGKEIPEDYKEYPAMIPKKVIIKFVKKLQEELKKKTKKVNSVSNSKETEIKTKEAPKVNSKLKDESNDNSVLKQRKSTSFDGI